MLNDLVIVFMAIGSAFTLGAWVGSRTMRDHYELKEQYRLADIEKQMELDGWVK